MEPFSLDAGAFCWINGETDDPEDLCLHGHAVARIAGETVEFDCAVSAAALYLLKSLTEDHLLGQGEQFFPCCGFFCIADEAGENVEIVGCDNGADWTLRHEEENVRLILPDVLLPATTALGTIAGNGTELGILAGANVVMPNLTPAEERRKYTLYDHKACTGSEAAEGLAELKGRMEKIGYYVSAERGDWKGEKNDV